MIAGKWSDGPPKLGAVELVELGSVRPKMGGILDGLGGLLGEVTGFFGNVVGTGLGFLSDALAVPLNFLKEGIGSAFTGLAGILKQIPVIGEIVAGLILVVNAAVQFVLELPGLILGQLSKVLLNLKDGFGGAFSKDQQSSLLTKMVPKVAERAPAPIQNIVKNTLEESNTSTADGETGGGGSSSTVPLVIAGVSAAVVAAAMIAA